MGFDDNVQTKTEDPIQDIKELVKTKMVAQKNLVTGVKKEDKGEKVEEDGAILSNES